jgi:hypothetical protein
MQEDDEPAAPLRPTRTRWIAAAAVGCIALVGTLGGWVLMGTSAKEPAGTPPAAVSKAAGDEGNDADAGRARPGNHRAAETPPPSAPAPSSAATPAAPRAPVEVPAVPTGQVRLIVPFKVDVLQGGTKVGTSEAPFELAAGRQRLELVNEELQYRSLETVDVRAAGRVRVQPAIPRGTANLNANPWAEVWIDGTASGQTPLGNLSLPIGPHQIVFRHPQLGEQTRTLIVTAAAPARLSVEMK